MFADRADAGRRLGARLEYLGGEPVVVLGLPRGGVPVALEVARALGAPLDVIVVRKLGVPFQPELGDGRDRGGRRAGDQRRGRPEAQGERGRAGRGARRASRRELERRAPRGTGASGRVQPLAGRTAVVVDDGIATGSTARAACQVARAHGAARVVLAVPVAPPGWRRADRRATPTSWSAWRPRGRSSPSASSTPTSPRPPTRRSSPAWSARPRRSHRPAGAATRRLGDDPPLRDEEVVMPAAARSASAGHLTVPEGAAGVVVFAHGSGSSRHSPRNRYVAGVLQRGGPGHAAVRPAHPARRSATGPTCSTSTCSPAGSAEVTHWLRAPAATAARPAVGYFGASTGAAAALWAAAEPGADIAAVVSRGGRPDLAGPRLAR